MGAKHSSNKVKPSDGPTEPSPSRREGWAEDTEEGHDHDAVPADISAEAGPDDATHVKNTASLDQLVDHSLRESLIVRLIETVAGITVLAVASDAFEKDHRIYVNVLFTVFSIAMMVVNLVVYRNKIESTKKTHKDDEEFRCVIGISDLGINVAMLMFLIALIQDEALAWAVPWFMPLIYVPLLLFFASVTDEVEVARWVLVGIEVFLLGANILTLLVMDEDRISRSSNLLSAYNCAAVAVDIVLLEKYVPT